MPTLANSGLTQTSLSLCSWLNSSNVICSICRIRNSLERTRIRSGRLVAARIDALGGVGSETLVSVQAMVGSVGSRLNAMSKRQFPVVSKSWLAVVQRRLSLLIPYQPHWIVKVVTVEKTFVLQYYFPSYKDLLHDLLKLHYLGCYKSNAEYLQAGSWPIRENCHHP